MYEPITCDKTGPMEPTYIRASEIGTYFFCRRAWHLARLGAPSSLEAERARGTDFHHRHGEEMKRAETAAGRFRWVWLAAALVLALLGLAVLL